MNSGSVQLSAFSVLVSSTEKGLDHVIESSILIF